MIRAIGCIINAIRQLTALILALLFIATMLLVLVIVNVNSQLLQPEVYKRAFAEQHIYDRFPTLVAEYMDRASTISSPCAEHPDLEACKAEGVLKPSEYYLYPIFSSSSPALQTCLKQAWGDKAFVAVSSGNRLPTPDENLKLRPCLRQVGMPADVRFGPNAPPFAFFMLDQSDWQVVLSTLLPADWAQAQVESVLDQVTAYLDLKTDVVKISLVELKSRVTGDAGVIILNRVLRAQPPCSDRQLAELMTTGTDMGKYCRPPDAALESIVTRILAAGTQALAKIPDEAILFQESKEATTSAYPKNTSPLGNSPREAWSRVHLLVNFSLLVPLALFLLMTLFGVRSRKGLLRWWGIPLLMVGLIGCGFGLLGLLGMSQIIMKIMPMDQIQAMGYTPELIQAGLGVGQAIGRTFVIQLLIQSGIILLLGLAFLIGSYRVGNRQVGRA